METFTIGREKNSDVQLTDKSVSNRHAEVVVTDSKKVFVTDCASQNGTFVWRNDRWVELRQAFILAEEWVRFGDVKLRGRTLAECKRQRTRGGKGSGPTRGSPDSTVISGAVRRNEFGEPVSRE